MTFVSVFKPLGCALMVAGACLPAMAAPFTATALPRPPADEILADGKVVKVGGGEMPLVSANGAVSAGTIIDPLAPMPVISNVPANNGFPGDTVTTFHNAPTEAFIRRDGQIERFTLAGMRGNAAVAFNDKGQVLGQGVNEVSKITGSVAHSGPFELTATGQAFVYEKGVVTPLGTLGGPSSWAKAINANGLVLGSSDRQDGTSQSFLYGGGQMMAIGPVGGAPVALNDMGQVIGHAFANGVTQSFLYSNGQTTMLSVPGRGSEAVAIASNGEVVLNAQIENGDWLATSIPYVYKDGQYTEIKLSGVKDAIGAQAHGVNALGMVTGLMRTADHHSKGFLYTDGQLVDLDSLVDPALGLHFIDSLGVDDLGRVIAVEQSGQRYVLSSVPESSSLAMTTLGLLAIGLLRRRR